MVLASGKWMSLESGESETYYESPLVCKKLAYYLKLFEDVTSRNFILKKSAHTYTYDKYTILN